MEIDISANLADGRTISIDGEWTGSDSSHERRDPAALDRVTGKFASATPGMVEDAFRSASGAFGSWAATVAEKRAAVLHRVADLLDENRALAAERLSDDMGKARADAEGEIARSAAIFRYFAGELTQPLGENYPSADDRTLLLTLEQPLGVVAVITPWNFPFAIPAWKIAPAIAFGNTVVWKPAEAASGSAVFLMRVLELAGLPPGVVNLITGSGRELSPAITGSPELAAITFTGSGPVGTLLRQAVADRNIKVQLEMGGKNAAVVLADADLDNAVEQVARGAMLATGQRCTATSRVYVAAEITDEFTASLKQKVESMTVGSPRDPGSVIGPLASTEQLETVTTYADLARAEGAEFVTGGDPHPDGNCFFNPVILTGVDPGSRLVTEEIFGPVVIVSPVDDPEEGLRLANRSEFGLSAAVFTQDLARAMSFVRGLEAGLVHVNRETAGVEPHVPFGGTKGSSNEMREQGKAARQFFTTSKTAYIRSIG